MDVQRERVCVCVRAGIKYGIQVGLQRREPSHQCTRVHGSKQVSCIWGAFGAEPILVFFRNSTSVSRESARLETTICGELPRVMGMEATTTAVSAPSTSHAVQRDLKWGTRVLLESHGTGTS